MKKASFRVLIVTLLLINAAISHAQTLSDYDFETNADGVSCTITWYYGPVNAVTIPNTIDNLLVTTIGEGAFAANLLTSVTITNNVSTIGSDAFASCINLCNIVLGTNMNSIGACAFEGCTSLKSITIPASVTNLDGLAFCITGLTNIVISSNLTSIGPGAFDTCLNMQSIEVDRNNPFYSSGNGVLFDKSQATLIKFPSACPLTSYAIPDTVTTIGRSNFAEEAAFFYNLNLSSVTIPNSIASVNGFMFCQNLSVVTIGTNVGSLSTCYGINAEAFADCPNLAALFFQGKAPSVDIGRSDGEGPFVADSNAVAYYLPEYTNWSSFGGTYYGVPAVELPPGSLIVEVTPSAAAGSGALWQIDSQGVWLNSGSIVTNLATGLHTISFSSTPGWATPSNQIVLITPNSSTMVLGDYQATTGALTVSLNPTSVANAGAQWHVDSGGAWQSSGSVISNLPIGEHIIYFSTISGWNSPSNQIVTIGSGTTSSSGVYLSQTYSLLHNFNGVNDGGGPTAGLISSGNTLFGSTPGGSGTIFSLNMDGTGFTNLHTFSPAINGTNCDGYNPNAILIAGNMIYGTAMYGGPAGLGTVFCMQTNGTGFTNLFFFTSANSGGNPSGCLAVSGNKLYGTTSDTLFSIYTNGENFTNLYNNIEHGNGVVISSNILYGTTEFGGTYASGSLFSIRTDGTGYTNLVSYYYTYPFSGVTLAGNTLYGSMALDGTDEEGNAFGAGSLYAIDTRGANGRDLHDFSALNGPPFNGGLSPFPSYPTNNDGANPVCYPVQSGNTVYGTAFDGGAAASGTIYCVTTNGGNFRVLYTFTWPASADRYGEDGGYPSGSLVFANNSIYGVASYGGNYLAGALFRLYIGDFIQFTANVTNGEAPLTVQFGAPNMGNSGDAITNWNWTFNDGSSSKLQNPIHIFSTPGSYLPCLVATNNEGVVVFSSGPQITVLDTNPPVLNVGSPSLGQRCSNPVFTIIGTAADNVAVADVFYSLNTGAWCSALTTNYWTNWFATVNLTPGTNTIAAYAIDTSGIISTTSRVTFDCVITNQLQLRAFGIGTFSPNDSNAWLEIGRNYSITSAPAMGFVFTNWTVSSNWIGGTLIPGTNLQFMMQSNLTLQATFVETSRPSLSITAPISGQHMTNALSSVTGTASDIWALAGVWYQLNNESWSTGATTNNWTNWTTTIKLKVGTNTLNAYALNLGGKFSTTNSLSIVSSNTFILQLAFTNSAPLKANGLVFNLDLSSGLNGIIQVSTNLTTWTTLTNFIGTNSTITFRDPAATNSSHRFYRAVIP